MSVPVRVLARTTLILSLALASAASTDPAGAGPQTAGAAGAQRLVIFESFMRTT